jgi:vancomycin resistance protein YoaR
MADLQKMKWQTEQDQITLDFSKWSQQRTRAKLSNDHTLWIEQRDDVIARQQAENAELRRKYLNGLAAAKAAKQAEHDAEVDAELEPAKQTLMRGWLANNPDQTEGDFEKKAWQHLRTNLIEQRKTAAMEATEQQLRASGRYNL